MISKYRNPWYSKVNQLSKEWYFIRHPLHQKIEEYMGLYIITGVNPWVDVVQKEGDEFVCITQRGSVRNAKEFIDNKRIVLESV